MDAQWNYFVESRLVVIVIVCAAGTIIYGAATVTQTDGRVTLNRDGI